MSLRNNVKSWISRKIFKSLYTNDKSAQKQTSRSQLEVVKVKKIGLRYGDVTSKDFEPPEYNMKEIQVAYDVDSYVRQGVDKYVDQIFKEGYDFFGKNVDAVMYVKTRLKYFALTTGLPFEQFIIEFVKDLVKYGNSITVKSRMTDQSQIPQSVSVAGLNGAQPIVGYFCLNPATMLVKRDKNGTILAWQQKVEGSDKVVKFKKEDVIHTYHNREQGNAFGASFLVPVLDDVKALRQAEENVLRMMYRNIYPFHHVRVGADDMPGTEEEVEATKNELDDMQIEGGFVSSNRVKVETIASNQVINAAPYLSYLENRIFSGMGIPGILFGRGGTANRNTGDNMTSEMCDRIKAIQKTVENAVNYQIILELLQEGGYDPFANSDDLVEFKFKENDLDTQIKKDIHFIYMYTNNAITEDEMRASIGKDPIEDKNREKMYMSIMQKYGKDINNENNSKETNNKETPENQHGTKTSPKKTTNSQESLQNLIEDFKNNIQALLNDETYKHKVNYINFIYDSFKKDIHKNICNKNYVYTVIDLYTSAIKDVIEN